MKKLVLSKSERAFLAANGDIVQQAATRAVQDGGVLLEPEDLRILDIARARDQLLDAKRKRKSK